MSKAPPRGRAGPSRGDSRPGSSRTSIERTGSSSSAVCPAAQGRGRGAQRADSRQASSRPVAARPATARPAPARPAPARPASTRPASSRPVSSRTSMTQASKDAVCPAAKAGPSTSRTTTKPPGVTCADRARAKAVISQAVAGRSGQPRAARAPAVKAPAAKAPAGAKANPSTSRTSTAAAKGVLKKTKSGTKAQEKAPVVPVAQVAPPVPETRPTKKLFELPPLSTFSVEAKKKDAIKRKVLRKILPPQEDIKKLREVVRSIRAKDVSVQEFIGLAAPYTGDNANVFREILANEMGNFRTMARRIYDTMTQDVSDVLTNEHVQLIEFQREKYNLHEYRMMRAIDRILECANNFNFEAYHENPERYLQELFPVYTFTTLDDEQQDLLLRHQAYHRLQWLKAEGERLAEENGMLQSRLRELKAIQKAELERKVEMEIKAEEERSQLEAAQEDLQEQLNEISTEVERTLVESERLDSQMQQQETIEKKSAKKAKKVLPRTSFATEAAQEIETEGIEEVRDAELSMQSVAVESAPKKTKRKGRRKFEDIPIEFAVPKAAPAAPRQTSPFHYSPPKTPPRSQVAERQTSPFHYSPPRAPTAPQPTAAPAFYPPPSSAPAPQAMPAPRQTSPFHYSPPRSPPPTQARPQPTSPFHYSPPRPQAQAPPPQEVTAESPRRRIERTTTITEPLVGAPRRRGIAPKDTWRGFQ